MAQRELARFEIQGTELAVQLAGDRASPALLLIHGFPSSSLCFRDVVAELAKSNFVIAPDLPGFGQSPPVVDATFARFADLVERLLAQLAVPSVHLYLHDFGAAVGLHLATRNPRSIRSLIIQNANAHDSGLGPEWAATQAYWDNPTPERRAKATAHLTFEGTRDQYIAGVPEDVARRMDPRRWEDDWKTLSLPGRLETQRALVFDYRNHVARFGQIAEYLRSHQPPALMLWGRHDAFFQLDETLSWMKALPRMEAHVLDGPHFLLETHARQCGGLMREFLESLDAPRR
jgi:pimeloyl-ACP methyl ester carboxylesterase